VKELKYFLSNVGLKSFSTEEQTFWAQHEAACISTYIEVVDSVVRDYCLKNPQTTEYSDEFTPREFENFCAELLESQGWKVQLGKGTQDQGVDILCEKDGERVCIQCKQYSQPVGNKAVQEVYAGMKFSGANKAAVVSNATFTPSARQLASTNKVLLLHYDELKNLASLI